MKTLLVLAGLGQLVLALASLSLPSLLRWREQVARLEPLTQRVFWTYSAYILGTNVALGVLSLGAPESLLTGTTLARAVAGYAGVYWGARLVLQLTWYSPVAPRGRGYRLADWAVTALFAALAGTFGAAAVAG